MDMMLLPLFADIFANEKPPVSRKELLKDIPTDAVVRVCCHINAQLHHGGNNFDKEEEIFKAMVSRTVNDQLRNYYWNNWKAFKAKNEGQRLGIFPVTHTMQLMQEALLNFVPGVAHKVTEKQELDLLRALLLVNTEANDRFEKNIDANIQKQDIDKVYGILWSSLLIHSTMFLRKEFVVTLYKSFHFFEYLNKNHKPYLDNYLKLNNTDAYQKLIVALFNFYFNGFDKSKNVFAGAYLAGVVPHNEVINQITLDVVGFDRAGFVANGLDQNFKGFRTFPLLKQENGNLAISNWDFFVDKLYDGLVFDFYNRSGIAGTKGFITFPDYKSVIGENFANALFMDTMKTVFDGHGNVAYREKERNADCDYDFYLRIENHVFLFEFKDILFPIKETYEEIKKVLDAKLVDGKKGVKQLVRHMTRLAKDPAMFDDFGKYKVEDLIVHPFIVYTDSAFGITGINSYLNDAFVKELPADVKSKFAEVKKLNLLHWDYLFQRYDQFKNREFTLLDVANNGENLFRQRHEAQRAKPSVPNFLRTLDGFDIPAEEAYPIKSISQLNGTLFKVILERLKGFLPDK